MFTNVRQELVDMFEESLSIAEEYGYKPSSYGVRGDVIKSVHAMFVDKQNNNVRAFAMRVKIKGSIPVTYVTEVKSHNDIIDALTIILESNKLVELHSEDEFRDFINRLKSKSNSVIKMVEETEELTLEVW